MLQLITSFLLDNLDRDEKGKVKKTPILTVIMCIVAVIAIVYMHYTSSTTFDELRTTMASIAEKQITILNTTSTLKELRIGNNELIGGLAKEINNIEHILSKISDIRNIDLRNISDKISELRIDQLSEDVSNIRNVDLKRIEDAINSLSRDINVTNKAINH